MDTDPFGRLGQSQCRNNSIAGSIRAVLNLCGSLTNLWSKLRLRSPKDFPSTKPVTISPLLLSLYYDGNRGSRRSHHSSRSDPTTGLRASLAHELSRDRPHRASLNPELPSFSFLLHSPNPPNILPHRIPMVLPLHPSRRSSLPGLQLQQLPGRRPSVFRGRN